MQILEVNGLRKVYTTRFGGASVEASPSWANPAPARPRS